MAASPTLLATAVMSNSTSGFPGNLCIVPDHLEQSKNCEALGVRPWREDVEEANLRLSDFVGSYIESKFLNPREHPADLRKLYLGH